jgi:hypothetical protein
VSGKDATPSSLTILRRLIASFPDVPVEWAVCNECGNDLTGGDEQQRGTCVSCWEEAMRDQRDDRAYEDYAGK